MRSIFGMGHANLFCTINVFEEILNLCSSFRGYVRLIWTRFSWHSLVYTLTSNLIKIQVVSGNISLILRDWMFPSFLIKANFALLRDSLYIYAQQAI
jgi:hypothetical protein